MYDYDPVHNQTKVTETDGSETSYTCDGMGCVTEMRYSNGWAEYDTYDKMVKVEDTYPGEKPAKTQKNTYPSPAAIESPESKQIQDFSFCLRLRSREKFCALTKKVLDIFRHLWQNLTQEI